MENELFELVLTLQQSSFLINLKLLTSYEANPVKVNVIIGRA